MVAPVESTALYKTAHPAFGADGVLTFHLGPPLLLRHTASKPHAQPGKLLPFPVRTLNSGQK